MAQVVVWWHSVWAGWVWIPGQTRLFPILNCCQSILTGCWAFSNLFFFFLLKLTMVKFINCYLTLYQEKGKNNTKRSQERPVLKKHRLILALSKWFLWRVIRHLLVWDYRVESRSLWTFYLESAWLFLILTLTLKQKGRGFESWPTNRHWGPN